MEIAENVQEGTYDVTLRGKFTFGDHSAFREVLTRISEPNVRKVILHMGLVEFVDSAALGMLLLAHDEAEKYQKSLVLSGAAGQVKKMFDMARFNTLFSMA